MLYYNVQSAKLLNGYFLILKILLLLAIVQSKQTFCYLIPWIPLYGALFCSEGGISTDTEILDKVFVEFLTIKRNFSLPKVKRN